MGFTIRNWKPGDAFDPELAEEIGKLRLTPELLWVAIEPKPEGGDGPVYGYLMGAAGHGIGWLMRLRVVEGHSHLTALGLIHRALGDFKRQGLAGFTVMLDQGNEPEARLREMMRSAGAVELSWSGVWCTLALISAPTNQAADSSSEAGAVVPGGSAAPVPVFPRSDPRDNSSYGRQPNFIVNAPRAPGFHGRAS